MSMADRLARNAITAAMERAYRPRAQRERCAFAAPIVDFPYLFCSLLKTSLPKRGASFRVGSGSLFDFRMAPRFVGDQASLT